MVKHRQLALNDAAEWLGDWHPLAEQLGSTDGLVTLGSVALLLRLPPVQDRLSLERFLREYQSEILLNLELPAIQEAHGHVAAKELRELIEQDQRLSRAALLQQMAAPSRRVGRAQLQKLRPLRDQRLVQRYLHAVNAGLAHGWHTVVYGLTLEVYSLPVRQGLLGYAHQTMRSFIYSAARVLRFSEHDCREVFESLCEGLPRAVDGLVRCSIAA